MPTQYGDAAYWLNAAVNARAMAANFDDSDARAAMLEVANKFEAMARAHAQGASIKLVESNAA